ncbi:hypothetical protein [Flavobacterium tructae]|uniref:hypothetical protein n=1 Tax=Flavobacterium tructae TaxID=1114873 RepID=UPI0035A92846
MKNIIYSFFAFLTTLIFYSQDFNYLKNADTLYIEFKGNKNEKKYSIQTRVQPNNFDERAYNFLVQDKWHLYFQHLKYKNWEKQEANIVSEVRNVTKFFLKKRRNNIIGIDFFKKHKSQDIICELLTQLKVFYIIDFTEKKKGKVNIYEVNSNNVCHVSE